MSTPAGTAANANNKIILIVEDDPAIRKMEEKILSSAGYQIHIAEDAEQGLRKVRTHKYDLVMLDVMMPGMNGYDFARTMREDANLQSVPVLFVTARGSPQDVKEGFQSGGMLYLVKPFTSAMLLTTVKAVIG